MYSRNLPSRYSAGRIAAGTPLFMMLLAILCGTLAQPAWADTVILKDGTQLVGTATQLAGGKLSFTTTYAGAIQIDWATVTRLTLDKPLLLILAPPAAANAAHTKQASAAQPAPLAITALERNGSDFTVTTATGTQTVLATSIALLRTDAAQKAYEASLHPGWTHDWNGSANVSLAFARGNSNTTTIGSGITVARPTLHDKSTAYFNSLYTHDGILHSTTANITNGGLGYDHNLNSLFFGFATQDFNTNALQDLTLRSLTGSGLGYHARKTPRQILDLTTGLVWTHENYSAIPASATQPTAVAAITNNFLAISVGEQFFRKFGASSSFTEQGNMYANMNQLGQFEANVTATLDTHINKVLSWQTTFNDIEVTNPPPGTKDNDIILTTGLGISFGHK